MDLKDLSQELPKVELFAWVGEDELGSGEIGLKQAHVPAGFIPLVAVKAEKMMGNAIPQSLQAQAHVFKKQIRLCRFVYAETLVTIIP